MIPTALVTGASGFIGRHLVRSLAERGAELTCLVRRRSQTAPLAPFGVRLAYGDVTERESLDAAVAGVDVVYHLAGLVRALGAEPLYAVNEGGVKNLVDACAARSKPPTLVLVSSLAAAGPSGGAPRTEADTPRPVSHYGRSKRAGEVAAERRAAEVPTSIVRPPIVFGEADRDVFAMVRLVARGWHLVPGRKTRHYSLIHAGDLARFLIEVARAGERVPAPGRRTDPGRGFYFVADDQQPSYAELGELLARALGREGVRTLRAPEALTWITAGASELVARVRRRPALLNLDKAREGSAGSWTCSAAKAKAQLGFATAAPLAERLRQTADWYRAEGWI